MHVRLLLAIATMLVAAPISAQAQDKLRYGQIVGSVKSVSSLALYTAQRKGFLARKNIALEVIHLPGVHHMIEGLDKNLVDVSHTATPYLIQAALNGSAFGGDRRRTGQYHLQHDRQARDQELRGPQG